MAADPKAFRIESPCGRVWEVPIAAVREDYARYLVDADGITLDEAKARVEEWVSVSFWFYQQFDWDDVERCGKLVQEASAEQVRAALDRRRNSEDPANFAQEVPHG